MPVQTRQTTRKAIAAETARAVAHAEALGAASGSLAEYTARHGAAVRHELGPDASGATVVSTLIDRYLAQLPADARAGPPPPETDDEESDDESEHEMTAEEEAGSVRASW